MDAARGLVARLKGADRGSPLGLTDIAKAPIPQQRVTNPVREHPIPEKLAGVGRNALLSDEALNRIHALTTGAQERRERSGATGTFHQVASPEIRNLVVRTDIGCRIAPGVELHVRITADGS